MGAAQKLYEAGVSAEGIEARVNKSECQHRAVVESLFEDADGAVVVAQRRIDAGSAKLILVQNAILRHRR